jgi:RNA polymerase sigma factor (sigma-70 family)
MEAHRNAAPAPSGVPELFVRHTDALRALAQALLRDREQVDDVVQDTWLAWLESPPREIGQPTPWLKRVLRNRVINARRSRARRETYERAAARPEHVDENLSRERDEALRAVVNAVLALDEPAKEVVWQRYFENRSVEEIAGRLRLSVRAVYDRLTHAHAKLRRQLEGEFGGDERCARALLLLAGRGRDGIAATVATTTLLGAWLSAPGVLLAASAALVALVAWLAWRPAPDEVALAEAREAAPAALSQAVEPADDAATVSSEPEVQRAAVTSEVAVEAQPPSWARPGYEYELAVAAVDENDLPVAARALYAAPAGHTLNRIGETDDAGVLVARFRAFTSSLELDIASSPKGLRRRVRLSSGRSEVCLQAAQLGGTYMVSGTKIVTGRFTGKLSGKTGADVELKLTELAEKGVDPIVDHAGWITFVEPWLATDAEFGLQVQAPYQLELASVGRRSRELEVFGSRKSGDGALAELTGRLLDANGDPVPRGSVFVRRGRVGIWRGFEANDAGEYTASELEPGEYELRASGGVHGRALTTIAVSAGDRPFWEPRLDAGRLLEGRLLDRDGAPLADWVVQIDTAPSEDFAVDARAAQVSAHFDTAATDAEGRFAIPNVPDSFLRVLARPAWAPGMPAALVHPRLGAASHELELRAPLSAGDRGAQLRVTASLTDLRGVREAELHVVRTDSGQAVRASLSGMVLDEHGTPGGRMEWIYALEKLLPGDYVLELHLPARLPQRIGALSVEPGGSHELVERVTELAARLVVDARPGKAGGPRHARLVLRGAEFELVSAPFDLAHGVQLEIVPGEHDLVSDDGLRRIAAFEASAGAVTRVKSDGSLEPPQPQR